MHCYEPTVMNREFCMVVTILLGVMPTWYTGKQRMHASERSRSEKTGKSKIERMGNAAIVKLSLRNHYLSYNQFVIWREDENLREEGKSERARERQLNTKSRVEKSPHNLLMAFLFNILSIVPYELS